MKALTRKISFWTVLCLVSVLMQAQPNAAGTESLTNLTDSLLKSEIASFTIKGTSFNKKDSLSKTTLTLTEIPVSYCSDKEVDFSWSTFTGTVSTFIHLYFKGKAPDKTLDSIFLVTHAHFQIRFPRPAFQGLYQPNSCSFPGAGKKLTFFSPWFKAFYSANKKRLYIYMIGGNNLSRYEVTWVIVEDKYYTRIFDNIP